MITWLSDNWIEIFGAVTGILYVLLEIKQNRLLWPVGIVTSSVYVWVFLTGKLYADMLLQVYYVGISIVGWYWWRKQSESESSGRRAQSSGIKVAEEVSGAVGTEHGAEGEGKPMGSTHFLEVRKTGLRTGIKITVSFTVIYLTIWYLLSRFTDSPVPAADSFITSVSVVATWMLARKYYEHWYLWIAVNFFAAALFFTRELYPTTLLYIIYGVMSFAGLKEWRISLSR